MFHPSCFTLRVSPFVYHLCSNPCPDTTPTTTDRLRTPIHPHTLSYTISHLITLSSTPLLIHSIPPHHRHSLIITLTPSNSPSLPSHSRFFRRSPPHTHSPTHPPIPPIHPHSLLIHSIPQVDGAHGSARRAEEPTRWVGALLLSHLITHPVTHHTLLKFITHPLINAITHPLETLSHVSLTSFLFFLFFIFHNINHKLVHQVNSCWLQG